ncbi:beta-galactosidase [Bacteroides caccae]
MFIVRSGPYVCAEWEMGGLYFRIRWQTCQP